MMIKELTRRKNPNGVGFIENIEQWHARISAALALVPGTFLITPTVYRDLPDPLRNNRVRRTAGGGAVFCAHCAEWTDISSYHSVTITDDDVYYCENC